MGVGTDSLLFVHSLALSNWRESRHNRESENRERRVKGRQNDDMNDRGNEWNRYERRPCRYARKFAAIHVRAIRTSASISVEKYLAHYDCGPYPPSLVYAYKLDVSKVNSKC